MWVVKQIYGYKQQQFLTWFINYYSVSPSYRSSAVWCVYAIYYNIAILCINA